jgi:hypothetical protein
MRDYRAAGFPISLSVAYALAFADTPGKVRDAVLYAWEEMDRRC